MPETTRVGRRAHTGREAPTNEKSGDASAYFQIGCPACEWDSPVKFPTRVAAEADRDRHNREVHGVEDGPAEVKTVMACGGRRGEGA